MIKTNLRVVEAITVPIALERTNHRQYDSRKLVCRV